MTFQYRRRYIEENTAREGRGIAPPAMIEKEESMDLSIKTMKRKNGEVSNPSYNEEDISHSSSKLRGVDTCAG